MRNLRCLSYLLTLAVTAVVASCGNPKTASFVSDKTGMNFNDPKSGGFDVPNFTGQNIGPGLRFIEGGTFTMGQTEEDLSSENNNIPRRVTVPSFFMDETEVANIHYREYLYWLYRTYGSDYPDIFYKALPDTLVWQNALSYNDAYVENYLRYPAYNYYPVVGVNWDQAVNYCQWRTDRVNEVLLIKQGYFKKNPTQVSEDNFNYDAYLTGQYEGATGIKKKDLDPTGSGKRGIRVEDGILTARYRLPTEAEWEYAALALPANNPEPDSKRRRGEEVITDRQVYPWGDNLSTREGIRNQYQGEFFANFRRGLGDMAGIGGALNDNAFYTGPIYSYKPNAFGLYNMAGNVNEWVMDVYRPETLDQDDLAPARGNKLTKVKVLDDGSIEEKDSLGHVVRIDQDSFEFDRKYLDEIRTSGLEDFNDGDTLNESASAKYVYDYGKKTLVNNVQRVYKGGSWNDRAYYLSPGVRRFYPQNKCNAMIGFRCAQDRLGSPILGQPTGNYFIGSNKNRR